MPISAPIGVAALAAVVERDGLPVRLVDEQIERDDLVKLLGRMTGDMQPPYIFGFSVLTAAYRTALTAAKRLKDIFPDSVVCFGGPHPTALPDAVLAHPLGGRGGSRRRRCDYFRAVSADQEPQQSRRLAGRFLPPGRSDHSWSRRRELVLDLDSLPRLPYHLFAKGPYDMGFTMSSRGCPYKCIFCSNRVTTGKRYRFRNCQSVLEDLALLSGTYGQRHIGFYDDNFRRRQKPGV